VSESTESQPKGNLSFLEHLEEFRHRLIISVLALVFATIGGWFLATPAQDLLVVPLVHAQEKANKRFEAQTLKLVVDEDGTLKALDLEYLFTQEKAPRYIAIYKPEVEKPVRVWGVSGGAAIQYIRPMDPFFIQMKTAMIIGIVISLPIWLYQIWAFISPGLVKKEKKLVFPLLVAGVFLFPLGATFAYFLLDLALMFMAQFGVTEAVYQNEASAYLGFALTMMLSFGVVFELPLGIILANRIGFVSVDWLAVRRKYIFLFLLVLAAVITPTGDPFTLMAMALPLQVLFEISLIVCRVLERKDSSKSQEEVDD
jgi:Tat protein translocase TatC